MNRKDAFQRSVRNIVEFGDTDVLPFPPEHFVMYDETDRVVNLLCNLDTSTDALDGPIMRDALLSCAGYTGFRRVTQIDPLWNAYLLGLVVRISDALEQHRLPPDSNSVFSYRYLTGTDAALFRTDIGWREFQSHSITLANAHQYVLRCDIADFYPRIYHHRLENALRHTDADAQVIDRIMRVLSKLSGGVSYGLPVGGPAARLLSEVALHSVDSFLRNASYAFCRFVDDYHIFVDSPEQAYDALLFLSQRLQHEGLSLSKQKTQIMSSEEFVRTSVFSPDFGDGDAAREPQQFMSLRLFYDPYSPTADEDYESLKQQLSQYDVVGMLGREVAKERVHQPLTRKLIRSLQHLESDTLDEALLSLANNPEVLFPLLPIVIRTLRALLPKTQAATQRAINEQVRSLLRSKSYVLQVPGTQAFVISLLADDPSQEAEGMLARIYVDTESALLRRDVILAMARRKARYWLSEVRAKYHILPSWEQRAMIVASYTLTDEGRHWRKSISSQLTPFDSLVKEWAAKQSQRADWRVPL